MNIHIPQSDLLARLLDTAALRHRTISNNLANVNTPGYHRREVSFEQALAKTLQRGGEHSLEGVRPRVVENAGGKVRQDGNNVDVDHELGDLSKNALMHSTYSQLLVAQIATMRTAITGH